MLWHIIQNVIGLTIAFREFATANPDIQDSTQGNVHPCKYHQPGNGGLFFVTKCTFHTNGHTKLLYSLEPKNCEKLMSLQI